MHTNAHWNIRHTLTRTWNRKWHVSMRSTVQHCLYYFLNKLNTPAGTSAASPRACSHSALRGCEHPSELQAKSVFDLNKDFGEHGNIFLLHICSRNPTENKGSHSICRYFYFTPPLMVPLCACPGSGPLVCLICLLEKWCKKSCSTFARWFICRHGYMIITTVWPTLQM